MNHRTPTPDRIEVSPILMMLLVISAGLCNSAFAGDLFTAPPPSLYSDKRAFEVGDIVTILLMEQTSGSNESRTDSDFEHLFELNNGASGFLDFIPGLGLESEISSDQQARGVTSRQGSLRGRMSARVVETLPSGALRLEGRRTVEVNGEQQIIVLSGIVRPRDVKANNTVESYLIADATITYRGRGDIQNAARPGILSRIIGWLF